MVLDTNIIHDFWRAFCANKIIFHVFIFTVLKFSNFVHIFINYKYSVDYPYSKYIVIWCKLPCKTHKHLPDGEAPSQEFVEHCPRPHEMTSTTLPYKAHAVRSSAATHFQAEGF